MFYIQKEVNCEVEGREKRPGRRQPRWPQLRPAKNERLAAESFSSSHLRPHTVAKTCPQGSCVHWHLHYPYFFNVMEESVHNQLRIPKRNTPVESFDVTSRPNDNCEDSPVPSATMSGAYSNDSDLKHVSDEPIEESQNSFKAKATPNLENLPAELRTQLLLSMPDLPTLRALIHASPTMHAQYRYDRDNVLRTCLERELSGFFIDAYANLMSRVCELGSPRTDEKITNFLDTYRCWLSGASPLPDLQSIDSGHIHWMAAYHISVACPLAPMYSSWALENVKKTISSPVARNGTEALPIAQDSRGVSLSRSEEIRIFRALYRYETYHHLFGRNKGRRHGGFRHHEINKIFFSLFEPWEAEAIGCVDIFIRQKYKVIFSDVKQDLHPQNARFRLEKGTLNPEGSFNLDGEHDGKQESWPAIMINIQSAIL